MSRTSASFCLLLCLASCGVAQTTSSISVLKDSAASQVSELPPWESEAFSASPAAIMEAADKVDAPKTADIVVLLEEGHFVLQPDGRATETYRIIFKVLTQQGAEGWGDLGHQFKPWRQSRPVMRARVITADLKIHELDQKTIAESPVQEESQDIYSDVRVLRAPLPAIAPGSVVEEDVVTADIASEFTAGTTHYYSYGQKVPVRESRLIVDVPNGLAFRHKEVLLPELKINRSPIPGGERWTFEQGPMAPLDEVEPFLPGDIPSSPALLFSTAKDWNAVATRYGEIVDQRVNEARVPELIAGLDGKTRDEKIELLVRRLHHEVRYTGVEFADATILPAAPAEVLKRKFGDCKDKSTLLVAMLRAAGIPAYVALLRSGSGFDVPRDQPGMGLFDHAIVYVPGNPEHWIDATAEYFRANDLPTEDQGRLTLIAAAETTQLRTIPELSSSSNLQREVREFFLSEDGPARIVETTSWSGPIEGQYRAIYSGAGFEKDEYRKKILEYVETTYLAEKLGELSHSNVDDYSKPLELRVEAIKAKRGFVSSIDAAVAIQAEGMSNRLPELFFEESDKLDNSKSEESTKAKRRKSDLVLPTPFVTEWEYKIHPPPGYRVRALPEDFHRNFGSATLNATFHADKDGMVTASLRFDAGKRRWTPTEVEDARVKLAEFSKQDASVVRYDQIGAALISQGKIKEGLSEYDRLIRLHPSEALHHIQLSEALLAAGIGEAARQEAHAAVTLDPKNADAYRNLAWTLQHDLIGRRFQVGFDREGAVAAYGKAIALDPEKPEYHADLAILLEHDAKGFRYAKGSNLADAIAEYDHLKDKLASLNMEDNPFFDLFYLKRFVELRQRLDMLPGNATRLAIRVAATAATDGVDAAVAAATRLSGSEADRSQALASAGQLLLKMREYPLVADLMTSSAQGSPNAQSSVYIEAFHKARRHEDLLFGTDPLGVVQHALTLALAEGEHSSGLSSLLVPQLIPSSPQNAETPAKMLARALGDTSFAGGGSDFSLDTALDLGLVLSRFDVEGTEATGYRVRMNVPQFGHEYFFLARRGSSLKIIALSEDYTNLGINALEAADRGDLVGARQLLDWAREDMSLRSGDDELAGRPFSHSWVKGDTADLFHVRIAAASLACYDATTDRFTGLLLELKKKAVDPADRLNLDLALATVYVRKDRFSELLPLAEDLYKNHPRSDTAFLFLTDALRGLGDFARIESLSQQRLDKDPRDALALRLLRGTAVAEGKPALSRPWGKKIIENGTASENDYNSVVWYSLLAGDPDNEILSLASQGLQNSKSPGAPFLHTVASLYADTGKTKEARELILKAMTRWGIDEPNSDSWYVFGRVAEQYGMLDVARQEYARVERPERAIELPNSTYLLAQRRLHAIRDAKEKSQ